jgi:hypothetical protein
MHIAPITHYGTSQGEVAYMAYTAKYVVYCNGGLGAAAENQGCG